MTIDSPPVDGSTRPTLGRADRLQPFFLVGAIGVGLTFGRVAPRVAGDAGHLVSIGVFVLIALVMLNVDARNVAGAFVHRRFLAAAILLNFVVNPLVAWGLGAVLLDGHPELRVGLILFLVTPCIGWYLIFTELAGGDTELGIGLLGINVVVQVLLLPVYLALFTGEAARIGVATVVQSIGLYLVLPAVAAALVRRWWSRQGRQAAEEQQRLHVSTLKTLVLGTVIVSMFASQADVIFDELASVGRLIAPMVVFFGLAYATARIAARRIGLPHDQAALLVFTTTSRNSEASLAIAATAFASPLVALTVALGPVIELPLLVVMARRLRRDIPALQAR